MPTKIYKTNTPMLVIIPFVTEYDYGCFMRFYRKVPRLGKQIIAGLTYSILVAISFKTVPSSAPCYMHHVNAVEYHLWFPFDVGCCIKMLLVQFHFQLGKQSEHGASAATRENGECQSQTLWFSGMCERVRCHEEGATWSIFRFSDKIS
jgi:hypothetical protein